MWPIKLPICLILIVATLDRCFSTIELRRAKRKADEALQNRNRQLDDLNVGLRTIVEATRQMSTCDTLPELGALMLEKFTDMIDARSGSLFLVHDRFEPEGSEP